MAELFFKPVELTAAVCAISRIQEKEQILVSTACLHGDSVGGGMEILLEILGAVEIHVVVSNDKEARFVGDLSRFVVTERIVCHPEASFSALVNHVAGMDGKYRVGIVSHDRNVLVQTVVSTLWQNAVTLRIVRVGTRIETVFIGNIFDDRHSVLGVPVEPVGHPFFGVAAVDHHSQYVKTITR